MSTQFLHLIIPFKLHCPFQPSFFSNQMKIKCEWRRFVDNCIIICQNSFVKKSGQIRTRVGNRILAWKTEAKSNIFTLFNLFIVQIFLNKQKNRHKHRKICSVHKKSVRLVTLCLIDVKNLNWTRYIQCFHGI